MPREGSRFKILKFFPRVEEKIYLPIHLKPLRKEREQVKLGELISGLPIKEIFGDPAVEVKGLAYHSQKVEEGFLFAAIPGSQEDGKRFIPEALSRGAALFWSANTWNSPRSSR